MGGRTSLALALALCGCATAPPVDRPAAAVSTPYRLGPGDRLRVIVYGEPSLSNEFAVSDAGEIAFPLVGAVRAGGLTTADLQSALQAKLADGYLRDPRIAVEVAAYRPFYILGEVQHPGRYPWTGGLTLTEAVATAGGFTYRARTRRIAVRHAASAAPAADHAPETPVEPGDTITVKERLF